MYQLLWLNAALNVLIITNSTTCPSIPFLLDSPSYISDNSYSLYVNSWLHVYLYLRQDLLASSYANSSLRVILISHTIHFPATQTLDHVSFLYLRQYISLYANSWSCVLLISQTIHFPLRKLWIMCPSYISDNTFPSTQTLDHVSFLYLRQYISLYANSGSCVIFISQTIHFPLHKLLITCHSYISDNTFPSTQTLDHVSFLYLRLYISLYTNSWSRVILISQTIHFPLRKLWIMFPSYISDNTSSLYTHSWSRVIFISQTIHFPLRKLLITCPSYISDNTSSLYANSWSRVLLISQTIHLPSTQTFDHVSFLS